MKKGMTVVLANGMSFILVDSVTYSGEKYFAATKSDNNDSELYFFKVNKNESGDMLELINSDDNSKVIEALTQHMRNTF